MGQWPLWSPAAPSKAGLHSVLTVRLLACLAPVWVSAGGLAWVRPSGGSRPALWRRPCSGLGLRLVWASGSQVIINNTLREVELTLKNMAQCPNATAFAHTISCKTITKSPKIGRKHPVLF